jgi:uncharacterized membrane protein HdeD (DUF308 family)
VDSKIYFPGVAAAVAGVVGLLGVFSDWWETPDTVYQGTADVSGSLAVAMALGLFVFGAASVLLSDPRIRRAMNALFSLCAVILTIAALWGMTRADAVAAGAEAAGGIWVSLLAGALGIAAGVLAMRDVRAPENDTA